MALHGSQDFGEPAVQDQRTAPRTKVVMPAQLRCSGGRAFDTVVNDISLSGFSASSIMPMHPGTPCWLGLPGLENLEAMVVWWNDNRCGCAFTRQLSPVMHGNLVERFGRP